MGKVFDKIDDAMREWLGKQHLFFVSTAPLSSDGLLNCSPKGYDCFQILNEHEVAYLDLTGSGIETIAHLKENGRIVLMFCSFDQMPRIVRLHGKALVYEKGSPEFEQLLPRFESRPGARSIIHIQLSRISDSCGHGVPRYEFLGERSTLIESAKSKGEDWMADYRRRRNAASVDGLTGFGS